MTEAAQRTFMTPSEFLAWEKEQEAKHMFWDGQVYAMAGASIEHNLIVANVIGELRNALQGSPCRVFASDLKVRLSARRYVYSDVSVVCGAIERDPADETVVTNPRMVVEVLSESTEAFDRGEKFAAYRALPSVEEVLFVSQTRRSVERYTRGQGGDWLLHTFSDAERVLLSCVEASLPLDQIYSGVEHR